MRVLTLFLSAGKSLHWWQASGLLSRELSVYREYLRLYIFDRIQIFTYDTRDHEILADLARDEPLFQRIDLLAPPYGQANLGWALIGPCRYYRRLAQSHAFKTNQISGSWAAIWAAFLTRRPLILRMGYILSQRFAQNGQPVRAMLARLIERLGIKRAAYVVVTSQAAYRTMLPLVGARRLWLLPSYVDVTLFRAKPTYDFDAPVISIGRMEPQKNQQALIDACAMTGVGLVLLGKGWLEPTLKAHASAMNNQTVFAGTLDHAALPQMLHAHSIFLLPSLHEGLPKVLIEAMAVGLICIGTAIPGITDLIEDGVTGYLIDGFDAAAIAAGIERARSARDIEIGRRARAHVVAKLGLAAYVQHESALFECLN
ncbi:glycosyltransferase family 4 protein [Aquisediminimonas sediminicola]|uniref:glycosyltransferase family 4 protein n=1 Tax=Alteraquisediminimonas sediminicola TaxID=2676787 RepID=UPI001C8D3C5C|nr:glycosyltransferase family 4 protein [Aquisediminimonas sediminicola]